MSTVAATQLKRRHTCWHSRLGPLAIKLSTLCDVPCRQLNGVPASFLQLKYPSQITLLRGNHECASVNRIYGRCEGKRSFSHLGLWPDHALFNMPNMLIPGAGFYDDCKRRYTIRLWKQFTSVFNCLPLAAVVQKQIFCVHGGLSPGGQSEPNSWTRLSLLELSCVFAQTPKLIPAPPPNSATCLFPAETAQATDGDWRRGAGV